MQIPPTTHRSGSIARLWRVFVLALCAAILLFIFLCAQAAHATAVNVGSAPMLTWDSSMIYPGQNNNLPWGPVGEMAIVHGSAFLKPGQQLTLVLVQGDSNANPVLCSQAGVSVSSATVDSTGKFDAGFFWPAAAGAVGKKYSICTQTANHTPVSTSDSGPFTVLGGSLVIHASTNSVKAGGSVTVTGQNWLPPQAVTVVIGTCGTCVNGTAGSFITGSATSSNNGSFTATLTIPAGFNPGTYTIDAYAHMSPSTKVALLEAKYAMVTLPHLTISGAAATATPTATATVTPTVSPTGSPTDTTTATAAQTATAGASGTNSNNTPNSNSLNNQISPLFLVGALFPLLLTIIGLVVYMTKQRNKSQVAPGGRVAFSQTGRFNRYTSPNQAAYGYQQQNGPFGNVPNQVGSSPNQFAQQAWASPVAEQPTSPHNALQGAQQQNWPQNYPQDVPQQDWPQPAQFANTSPDPYNEVTVSSASSYGSACFKCGTVLPADSKICGNCGTDNNDFFS